MEEKVESVDEAVEQVKEAVRDAGYPWMDIEIETRTYEAEERHGGDHENPDVHVKATVNTDLLNYSDIQQAYGIEPGDGVMTVKFSFDLPADYHE